MKHLIVSLALTTAMFATPTLAQTSSATSKTTGGADASSMMTCKDLSAMDSSGQEKALQTMQSSMGSMDSGSMSSDKSGSMKSDASGSMKSGSADSSGAMKSDTSGSMKSGSADTSGAMSSGGDMSVMSTKVMTYCKDNPDAMVSDAMKKSSSM